MKCDPEKVRSQREKLGMTQDKLAIMSRVDKRTIQRLEAGEPIRLETLADVAAALRMTPDDIIVASNDDTKLSGAKDAFLVSMRKVSSAKHLRELVRSSTLTKLECEIEPTSENLPVLRKVIESLEAIMPAILPNGWYAGRHHDSLVGQLEEIAALAENLKDLEAAGFAVFHHWTFDYAIMPVFNSEIDRWYYPDGLESEPVNLVRLAIGPADQERITVRRYIDWGIRMAPKDSLKSEPFDMDTIPF